MPSIKLFHECPQYRFLSWRLCQADDVSGQAWHQVLTYPAMMKSTYSKWFTWLLPVVLVLSGCGTMTARLLTTRQQICNSDDSYSLSIRQGLNLTLKDPVLRDTDIVFLMDSPPTAWQATTVGKQARYIFEQTGAGPDGNMIATGHELEISFLFEYAGNDYVMTGIKTSAIPPEFLDTMTSVIARVPRFITTVCQSSINPIRRNLTLQIDEQALELIPARSWVIAWLGAPLGPDHQGTVLSYVFRLQGDHAVQPVAKVEATYDQAGEYPLEIDATYQRYLAFADIPEATVTIKVNF